MVARYDRCMESLDLRVLADVKTWLQAGHGATLFTVVETWGSAPRPRGAMLALRSDGLVSGSVSGGCIEDDLHAHVRSVAGLPTLLSYGVTQDEAARFGLPCGGSLRLVQEPLQQADWIDEVLQRTATHQLVARVLDMSTGKVQLHTATRDHSMAFDGQTLTTLFGPRWRLLLIGAGQLSQAVARMAAALDFEILVCDPREEYASTLPAGVHRVDGMPDDAVRALQPDAHTAIVALTHDPKLDDMALMEALTSDAFYVGALGSQRNQTSRKQRLATHFDLSVAQLERLHGPVGLRIGARTPAEIAVSILAEIIQVKNALAQPTPAACALA